ncbi:toxin-antitoxin system, toxin component [Kribbella sp. NPDC051770]|uniref:LppU/SCO3897 family protein n=1 Tax=Kribbella sp. NPDC051770 TaxID=3155413 RepID=UPI003434AE82
MTTTPPQPPHNPYAGQPGGYGPPQEQFPQYAGQPGQPQPGTLPPGQQVPGQPMPGQPGEYQGPPPHQAPYGQPQYDQQPGQQYQQPQHDQQFGQRQFQPNMPPVGALQCRFCGAVPAVQAKVRGHMGLLIVMRLLRLEGPFCKTCGTASVRDMTAKSMWQGWWGIGSAIINPFTMLSNIGPWKKFQELPEPAPGAPGRPMNPGKPLFKRPQVLGLLLPIAVIAAIVVGNLTTTTSSEAKAGDCVMNAGTSSDPDVKVVDCSSADAEFKVLGRVSSSVSSTCDMYDEATVTYTEKRGSTGYTLCLGPN